MIKLCTNCKWLLPKHLVPEGVDAEDIPCHHDHAKYHVTNHKGKHGTTQLYHRAAFMRRDGAMCGPRADLYEEK